MELFDVLGFLFMLSTTELGRVSSNSFQSFSADSETQEYSTEHLSKTQTAMLKDLVDYGLIWRCKVCLTPLMLPLLSTNIINSHHQNVFTPLAWLQHPHPHPYLYLPQSVTTPACKKDSQCSRPITGYTLIQVSIFLYKACLSHELNQFGR